MDDEVARAISAEVDAFEAWARKAVADQAQLLRDSLAKHEALNQELLAPARLPAPG